MSRLLLTVVATGLISFVAQQPLRAETAILAGGCFWCVESDLESVEGVLDVVSGYAGGQSSNPTYKTYAKGGHREAVYVEFDENILSYGQLLDVFLRTIDVTDAGGQFCDRGYSYSSAIYPLDGRQVEEAKSAVTRAENALGRPIVTPIEPPARFFAAEDYHQNYYLSDARTWTRFGFVKRSTAYKGYRKACGRDEKVQRVWGDEAYRGVTHDGDHS